MSALPVSYLDEQIRSQQAQHASVTDTHQWLTRYIFSPFKDCGLTLKLQGDFGIVGAIRAGFIIPITRRQQPVMKYEEVKEVPTYSDGSYHPSSQGVSTMKLAERAPSRTVEAIFRIFNAHHGTDANEDNGLCEVEALRGVDDMNLLRELNEFCFPVKFDKARLQIRQLEAALANAPSEIYREVIERLLAATRQSVAWANWHYANLEADMEDRGKTGKDRLSPLDVAVCKWIERGAPKFRSNLTGEAVQGQQVAPTPSIPTIQCEACGSFSNLLANGNAPKKCSNAGCGELFPVKVDMVEDSPSSLEMIFSPDTPMGETEAEREKRLKDEQQRAKEALKAKKTQ